jgi:hypothetical protein
MKSTKSIVAFARQQFAAKQRPCDVIRATAKRFPKARRVDLIVALTQELGFNPGTVRTQIQTARGR